MECFSNLQTKKLRSDLASYRIKDTKDAEGYHITCRDCTATQNTEMKCYLCDTVKGLASFSKNQRKTPDTAVSKSSSVKPRI